MNEVNTVVKPKLLINTNKSYKDAFSSAEICFYLPTDHLGTVVEATKAKRLERWVSKPDQRVKHLPDAISSAKGSVINALLRHDNDEQYGLLVRSVAFGTIKKMENWLHTLHRDPNGDLHDFETFLLAEK